MKNLLLTVSTIVLQQFCLNAQNYIGPAFVHATNSSNNVLHQTILPTAKTGSAAGKNFLICHNYGVVHPSAQGIYYTGTQYSIYNQKTTENMVVNDKFNVLEPLPANGTIFVHTVTAANVTSGYLSTIDNAVLNNNPNALFFITKNYDGFTYDNSNLGIWYNTSSSKWTIYNEANTGGTISLGLTITVFVPNSNATVISHRTTIANSDSYLTEIDHPTLNGNPNAILFINHEYDNTGTIYVDAPLSVRYDAVVGKWLIYSDDLTYMMPENAKFNVLVASEAPTSIGTELTTTAGKINVALVGNTIRIDAAGEVNIVNVACYNMAGVLCASAQENNATHLSLSTKNLVPGVYLVKVLTQSGVATSKVIVP